MASEQGEGMSKAVSKLAALMSPARFVLRKRPLICLLLLASTTCGSRSGDVCEPADRKLDGCVERFLEEGRGAVFFNVPLDTSKWHQGCLTSFDRCAAQCVLAASCDGIQRGLSSTDPNNDEPAFHGCLAACE